MKRSRILKLSIMSASALTLIACEQSQEVGVFENLEQCSNQAGFSREECSNSEKLARSEHIRVAPKYSSVTDCERDFGADKCEIAPQRTTTGGSVFMPMMMGYMMGSMLGGGRSMMPQPLYRSMDDTKNFRTGDNQRVSNKTGLTKVSKGLTRMPSTKTRTIRRGGFGAAARSVGTRFSSAGKFRRFGGFRSFGG